MTFARQVKAKGRCVLSSVVFFDDFGPCEGVIEAHHVIPKRRLRNLPKPHYPTTLKHQMAADPRNGVPVCQRHHHLLTVRARLLPREALPQEVWEFAAEHAIEWALDREIPSAPVLSVPEVSARKRTGRTSRSKGKRGELEVVHLYQEHGFTNAKRTGDAQQVAGDIAGVPDYTEVRRRERQQFSAWIAECREESGDKDWALFTRRSTEPWAVTVDAEHYLELLRKAQVYG